MDKKLSKLLNELYQLDPSLKAHDSLLRSVLGEILASRPEAQMDPAFYRDLRETLLSRIRERAEAQDSGFTTPRFSLFSRLAFPRLAYAFSGLAVVTGIAVLAHGLVPSSGLNIARIEPSAFGTLTFQSNGGEKGGGLGGGGETLWLPEVRTNYAFHYTGEALAGMDSVEVLKRVVPANAVKVKLDFDALDLDSLGQMEAAYTNLQPADGDGYTVNYDPNSKSISLNEFHTSSPECPWGLCTDWDTSALTVENVPSDEELIAVSDAFFEEIGLDRSTLTTPYVNDYFIGEGSEVDYILSVTYPFEMDGKPVYTSWGGQAGVTVSIDAHRMKVIGANWIYASQNFESSSYPGASAEEVLAMAGQGGVTPAQWENPTEVVNLDLGTPTLIYSQIQNYTEFGTYNDLYAPAYLFPILNDTEDLYYGDFIVVPLVEELVMNSPPNILY